MWCSNLNDDSMSISYNSTICCVTCVTLKRDVCDGLQILWYRGHEFNSISLEISSKIRVGTETNI